ncbi:MAG: dihydroorotate dehydrogenase [Candidatus Omnitrophota bacterium]
MNKMQIKIGNLILKNPVMSASGTFGYAEEFKDFMDLKMLGAVISKTITLKPRTGNPMPRICETAGGMLNSIGLENKGVDDFLDTKLPYLVRLGIPIIVSISGDSIDEFIELLKILDKEKDVDAVELNISCPNIKGKGLIAQDKDSTYTLLKRIRKFTNKALITKLSPNVTDISRIAKAAEAGGSDALSLINTVLGMSIDINTKRPMLGNIVGGLSGPCIKPIALRMVYEVSKNTRLPIIGIGGIMDWKDAIEFFIAGATSIQVGTANFIDPATAEKVILGIEEYLKKNKIKDIKDIVGSMSI